MTKIILASFISNTQMINKFEVKQAQNLVVETKYFTKANQISYFPVYDICQTKEKKLTLCSY